MKKLIRRIKVLTDWIGLEQEGRRRFAQLSFLIPTLYPILAYFVNRRFENLTLVKRIKGEVSPDRHLQYKRLIDAGIIPPDTDFWGDPLWQHIVELGGSILIFAAVWFLGLLLIVRTNRWVAKGVDMQKTKGNINLTQKISVIAGAIFFVFWLIVAYDNDFDLFDSDWWRYGFDTWYLQVTVALFVGSIVSYFVFKDKKDSEKE